MNNEIKEIINMQGEQLSIYDIEYKKYKITKPIRLIELFTGYGSQALALKYLNVPFEHWKICEWAIKSIQAYKDIHFTNEDIELNSKRTKQEMVVFLYQKGISSNWNEPMAKQQIERLSEDTLKTIIKNIAITHNLVNIQQVKGKDLEIVDTDKYCYIMTYSFPCQDLSLAGKGKGMSDTSTRSGMLWEVERILQECKDLGELPQVLLMENVPQVHSQDNLADFNKWKLRLEEFGYNNYFQDLIVTDYGIPQTRNRCFMVSILGDYSYTFPKPIPLKLRLKDMLEQEINIKYYLSKNMINYLLNKNIKSNFKVFKPHLEGKEKIAHTIMTSGGKRADDNFIICNFRKGVDEKYYLSDKTLEQISNWKSYQNPLESVMGNESISPTITTRIAESQDGGINASMKVYCNNLDNTSNLKKYYLSNKMIDYITSKDDKYKANENKLVINREVACSKTTREGSTRADASDYICRDLPEGTNLLKIKNATQTSDLRIRKLTPKECFRLMGVKDEDYENCKKNQSDSSLYHLAGDSIVVNVLMAIFKELL